MSGEKPQPPESDYQADTIQMHEQHERMTTTQERIEALRAARFMLDEIANDYVLIYNPKLVAESILRHYPRDAEIKVMAHALELAAALQRMVDAHQPIDCAAALDNAERLLESIE